MSRLFKFRFGLLLTTLAMILVSVSSACGWVQDDQPGQAAIDKWTTAVTEIQELVNKVRAATGRDRDALIEQHREKVKEINSLRNEIEPQLLAAVQDATEITGPIHDTLFELAQIAVSEDSFPRAARLLKPLVATKSTEPAVYQFAAMAAYGSDQFEEVERLLAKIKEDGGSLRLEFLRRSVDDLGARIADWQAEKKIREEEAEKGDLPQVKLETTAGDIVIELYEDQAPNTVANFISLIEKGYYDGLTFHRVIPQFMAQGGCPNGAGTGGPGYSIPCECGQPNYRKHFSGTLSMAHAGPNTGGSQFFLTFLATPHLDGKHTAFGRIVEGMDVLASIEKVDPQRPNPTISPSRITKATVLRKRDHEYKPKTLPSTR